MAAYQAKDIVDETRRLLSDPRTFFSGLPLQGGFAEPVIRAAAYGLAAGIANLLMAALGIPGLMHRGMGPGMQGFAPGAGMGLGGLVAMPVMALVGLFIGGGLLLLLSAICKGRTGYEACVRITSCLMVGMVISQLAMLLFVAGPMVGGLGLLAASLYSLWLGYMGLVHGLKADQGRARIAVAVLAVLSLLSQGPR